MPCKNRFGLVIAVLCAGVVMCIGSVHATESVQDRKAVMEAQIDLLKKQAELDRELQLSAGMTMTSMPQVLSVIGLDGKMTARLQFSNGLVSNYVEGEVVRSGMRVASITPKQVALTVGTDKKKSKLVVLDFVAGASMMPGISAPGGVLSRPVPKELLPDPPYVPMPTPYVPLAPAKASASAQLVAPTPAPAPAGATPAAPAPAK